MSRVLLLLSLLCSVLHSQWIPVQVSSNPESSFTSVHFINRNLGWAAAAGLVIKSTDGGLTWTSAQLTTKEPLTEIYFLTETTGFVIGRLGTILKSTDGGETWKAKPCPVFSWLDDISFLDQKTGYIAAGGSILKTTDEGETWQITYTWKPADVFDNVRLVSINCYNGATIVVANNLYYTKTGAIISSTDEGGNWKKIDVSFTTQIADAFFIDKNNGWVGEELSGISKTTNGGIDWINSNVAPAGLQKIFFVDKFNGWASFTMDDESMIYNTTDGGVNWNLQLKETGDGYYSIFFIDRVNGWAAGPKGIILKTLTGGEVTSSIEGESFVQQYSVLQNYPNPFNPSTKILYELPYSGNVQIKVFDALGNEVETLINGYMQSGTYYVEFNAANLPGGVYFYRIISNNYSETKKMLLLK